MSTDESRFERMWMGDALIEIVRIAERLGVLAALETPTTPCQLSESLGLSERAVTLMLPALCATGYVERAGTTFRRPADPGIREAWPRLEAFMKTGEVPDLIDRTELRGGYYKKSVLSLGAMFERDARVLAEQLRPAARIADVGAGSGVWSYAMAEREPEAHVVAVDRDAVIPSTREAARMAGLEDRVRFIIGDYFEVELDTPVDRVVMANVLHLESEADAARLVGRYAAMLAEGGELVIVDILGGPAYLQQVVREAYALHLGMRTRVGRAHHEDTLIRMCADAGLPEHRVLRLEGMALGAVVCSAAPVETLRRATVSVPASDLEMLRAEVDQWRGRFEMVFEGSVDATIAVDKRGEAIVTSNRAFHELLGVDWTSLQLHDLSEVVAPHDLERCRQLVIGMARGEITERRHRITMRRGDETFSAELSAYDPLARSVVCFVVRDHDRVAREEKLLALGELVGGLMHDLNTPLANAKANSDLADTLARRAAKGLSEREATALQTAASDALTALAEIERKLASIEAFATLEGAALQALAPHFKSGLARAICERVGEARGS